jgi:hypothetical protein
VSKKGAKVLVAILAGGLLLVGGGVFALRQFLLAGCASNHLDESRSPFGSKKAEIFNFDCGATTGFITSIAIIDASAPTPSDNDDSFFIADADHGLVPDSSTYDQGGPRVKVTWISADKLEIRYPKESRIFRSEKKKDGIEVSYVSE